MPIRPLLMVVALLLLLGPTKANVLNDPLGLRGTSRELSEGVERALAQLNALEKSANKHVEERLEQIRSIVKDALKGGQEAIDKAVVEMNRLETQINKDAIEFLYRAQCLAEKGLMDQAQRAFSTFIENFIKADPKIVLFGIKIVSASAEPIVITDPDKAYFSTKAAVIARLNKDTSDNSLAYDMLSAYQNLERGAMFTRCHYLGQSLDVKFVREVNELERLSKPWVTVVDPTAM